MFNREQLKAAIKASIIRVYQAQHAELDLYRNTLDCFSAAIDALIQGISLDEWMVQERARQVQKTKQNAIGELHQEIIGAINGVQSLPNGNVIDIVSTEKRIIAEIKNKYNTTKGNHKINVYHDLASILEQPEYENYTAYYVEVLPKNGKNYNKPFTPSDNKSHSTVPEREDIRVIDGKSFYALLTGNDNAINELYFLLPHLIAEILKDEFNLEINVASVTESSLFSELLNKAYLSD